MDDSTALGEITDAQASSGRIAFCHGTAGLLDAEAGPTPDAATRAEFDRLLDEALLVPWSDPRN